MRKGYGDKNASSSAHARPHSRFFWSDGRQNGGQLLVNDILRRVALGTRMASKLRFTPVPSMRSKERKLEARDWLRTHVSLLSCDHKLLSFDGKLLGCDRKLLSCDRKLLMCNRKLLSCDRKLISCTCKLLSAIQSY